MVEMLRLKRSEEIARFTRYGFSDDAARKIVDAKPRGLSYSEYFELKIAELSGEINEKQYENILN